MTPLLLCCTVHIAPPFCPSTIRAPYFFMECRAYSKLP